MGMSLFAARAYSEVLETERSDDGTRLLYLVEEYEDVSSAASSHACEKPEGLLLGVTFRGGGPRLDLPCV